MNTSNIRVVATLPPYVDHREEIITSPYVDELRFNTVMPLAESKEAVIARLQAEGRGKRLWLDLKTRQLRITKFAYMPYAYVELSHPIRVNLPTVVYFKDAVARVARIVDGNKLILAERPGRIVGAGEPVNILDPSLRIRGFLTENDHEFVAAANRLGLHDFMLSFTERPSDIDELLELDPEANIIAKIESLRGLKFACGAYRRYRKRVRLMAARDDLYINMGRDKLAIFQALQDIISQDPQAYVASRLLTSLETEDTVSLGDLSDWRLMEQLGFKNFMLSDGLCFQERACMNALSVVRELRRRE